MANLSDDLISNISYTNKDFGTIYPEFLDLVSKITNKWDPSQSNESDPGVVLLKLAAIMADKNNYNIDKNVLECFPLSVTQEENARKLYDSLGYNMHWYKSAITGDENLIGFLCANSEILKNTNGDVVGYEIPAFTSLTDSTNEIIYTTLQKVKLENTTDIQYTPCIQGSYKDYTINGERKISVNALDSERRLYFTDSYIAENGIFILDNVDESQQDFYQTEWKRVDNLTSYPSGNRVYQFGVTANNTCYIQFPNDISTLIGNGMFIRYMISNGESGNIKANTLTNFATDLASTTDSAVTVNDSIRIIQTSAIINGENPETLEDAYKNYKKTIGTFNTLVTRRDYENFIDRIGETSNCVVSDRTNDINYSNYIQVWGPDFDIKELKVKEENGQALMNAFKIYLYLNKYINNVNSLTTYLSTFTPDNDAATLLSIEGQMDEIKAVQHDVTIPEGTGLVFNYNNIYTINGLLYLKYKVTNIEKNEIEANVKLALMQKFNAKNVEFGEELDYQEVVDTIIGADDRISNVLLSALDYKTSERSLNNTLTPLPDSGDYAKLNELVARMVLAGNVQLFNFEDNFQLEFGQENSITDLNDKIIKSITTETNITLKKDEPADQSPATILEENEVVELWADNYVTSKEYGAYCKVVPNFTIPANELHKLLPQREIDGQTIPAETIEITYYDSENGIYKPATLTTGDVIECNTEITSNGADLRANQYLRVKVKNEYQLTQNSQYLAIFNTVGNVTITSEENGYRILQENEYFIYPNSTKTDLIILGMGTKLSIGEGAQNLILENSTEEITKINKNNIDTLDWDKLPVGSTLTTTETTIYAFGQNVSLFYENNNSLDTSTLQTLTNKYQSLGNRTLYYKEQSNVDYGQIISNTTRSFYIRSRLNLNSTINNPQQIIENQKVTLNFTDGSPSKTITPDTPANSSDEIKPKYLQFNSNVVMAGGENLDMGVVQMNSSGETTIDYNLKAYCYNLNPEYTLTRDGNALILPTLQNSTVTFKETPTLTKTNGTTTTPIETTITLDFTSNDENFKGIIIENNTINYKKKEDDSKITVYPSNENYDWDDYKTIKITDAKNTSVSTLEDFINTFNYSLPFTFGNNDGIDYKNYLVPVKVILSERETGDETPRKISLGNAKVYNPYEQENITEIEEDGSYILQPTQNSLNITIYSAKDSVIVGKITKLGGLNKEEIDYRDLNQNYVIDNEISDVLIKMQEIDGENKFDWTYRVDKNDKVTYPTAPSSFWNTNHLCNDYTLPVIDFENSSITVSPSYLQD